MKSTTTITIIPTHDGFIDELVPGAGAVIADRLANAGWALDQITPSAPIWRMSGGSLDGVPADQPPSRWWKNIFSPGQSKRHPQLISPRSLAGIRWYIRNILISCKTMMNIKRVLSGDQQGRDLVARGTGLLPRSRVGDGCRY